jgi:hypothetical protein
MASLAYSEKLGLTNSTSRNTECSPPTVPCGLDQMGISWWQICAIPWNELCQCPHIGQLGWTTVWMGPVWDAITKSLDL